MDGKQVGKVNLELKEGSETAEKITPAMVRGASVRISGIEIPLAYDLRAQITIEDELGLDWDELRDKINNLKNARNTKLVVRTLRILGNRAAEKAGETPDLTDDWLMDHISLHDMMGYKIAILGVLTAGWYMETDDSADKEIDLGLIEIRKKNGKTD